MLFAFLCVLHTLYFCNSSWQGFVVSSSQGHHLLNEINSIYPIPLGETTSTCASSMNTMDARKYNGVKGKGTREMPIVIRRFLR